VQTLPGAGAADAVRSRTAVEPTLSVIVPVFNQAAQIVENLRVIRHRIGDRMDEPFEIVVVSDGSIDQTTERLLESRAEEGIRVFHYDRNLGKGYAIKVGALEARGRWIGFVDADLDLDAASLVDFVREAEDKNLDFVIGSKRHPDSDVHYPRSRRVASWLFQQLVRLLFRLDVRDTQVGLKVFRREVADQVLPLLLVKRYAFDLELLAVARAFGFSKLEEQPIRLEYRFTGSGVRSIAVLRALIDTAAIFYRLRILRYYQRKRALAGAFGWTRPRGYGARVSVVADREAGAVVNGSFVGEVIEAPGTTVGELRAAVERAEGDVVAFVEHGARVAANWLSATTPFFRRGEIAAVVFPKMAPHGGPVRARAAAAVRESRVGGGSVYFRFAPGNLRYVDDFPTRTFLVRKSDYLALDPDTTQDDVVAQLAASGARVLYTPETVVVADPLPLYRPHLAATFANGRRRGSDVRRRGRRSVGAASRLWFVLLTLAAAIVVGQWAGGWGTAAVVVGGTYAAAVLLSAIAAALRFRSADVGAVTATGVIATHAVFAAGFVAGVVAPA
jgi:glycosyltransferase involved in cell wall biosynthesis